MGMALGILFIVPLGDMLDRKRLVAPATKEIDNCSDLIVRQGKRREADREVSCEQRHPASVTNGQRG